MKKILLIILVIIMFIVSTLIFWAGFSPGTFQKFFLMYPKIGDTFNQIGISNNNLPDLSDATSSEPVLGSKGIVSINGNYWNVEIADNELSRTNGLSNRKTLRIKDGLLFVFENFGKHPFWMKDMLIPIDMIFFDADWQIVLIESNLQPDSFPKIFGNDKDSRYVLEVNANESIFYGLKVGDRAIFLNK